MNAGSSQKGGIDLLFKTHVSRAPGMEEELLHLNNHSIHSTPILARLVREAKGLIHQSAGAVEKLDGI